MATKTWNGSNADWYDNSGGDWSPTGDPATTDDVSIPSGTVTLANGDAGISVNSITLSSPGVLQIHDPGATQSVTGNLTNSGTLDVDTGSTQGGSSLTVGGVLANTGTVQAGSVFFNNTTAPTALTLGGLTNASGASFSVIGSSGEPAELSFTGAGFTGNAGSFGMDEKVSATLNNAFDNTGTFGVDNFVNVFGNSGGSSLAIAGTLTNSGTFTIGNSNLSAPTTVTAGGLSNTGTLTITGNTATQAALVVSPGNTFTQTAGTTTVNAGGTLASATIDVTGGLLDFTSAITAASGTGNFEIGGNGIVEFGSAVDAGHGITFTSTAGTMELGAPGQFAPTTAGFVVGDKIDLLKTAVTGLSYASGVLTVTNGSTTVASLNLAGAYSTADFTSKSDNNGGTDIELTQNPASLAITLPPSVTVGVGQPDPITGVSIAESPSTSGETFTVILSDTNGVLAATGGTQSNGGKTLTVTGSLSQVNADLAALTDTDPTTPSDTITITASDSNGGMATSAQIPVTVNSAPVIAAPVSTGVAMGRSTPILGVRLSES